MEQLLSVKDFVFGMPMDWVVIGVFAALWTLESLRSNGGRAAALALALPTVLAITTVLPDAFFAGKLISGITSPWAATAVFLVILAIMFVLVRHMMGESFASSGPLFALIAGCAVTVVTLIVWLNTDALNTLWDFSPQIETIFDGMWTFWWLTGAYAALAFARE